MMICTKARGGMFAVVDGYKADGLFDRWNISLLVSHSESNIVIRSITATNAIISLSLRLLSRRISFVHCHVAMKGSFWRKSVLSMIAIFARTPVAFHLHGSEMKDFVSKQPKLSQLLISWILAKQSVVIVLSESWLHYVKSISPKAKVKVIRNYVNLPDLRLKDNDHGRVEVLFLGLVGRRKGIYDLLAAFKEALNKVPEIHLTVGGNGEVEKARLLADNLGINKNITFAGWVGGEQKEHLLKRASFYVLPSYNEGLPVSLLEAMSWNMPVISTRVGGIPELVDHGIDGFLIDAGDQKSLSESIILLANNEKLRKQMGDEARRKIENNFSREVVLPELESLYQSLTVFK